MLKYLDLFEKIGLDDKEARVYLAAIKLGRATAEQLAKEASILRTTTYYQIESLLAKNLITTYTAGKKTLYVAESPANLTQIVERQERDLFTNRSILNAELPELINLFGKSGSRPVVRFFPGKAGLQAMREEVLQMQGKELLVVSNYEKFLQVYDNKERDRFSRIRSERGINTRVLYTESPLESKQFPYLAKKYAPKNVRVLPPTEAALGFDIYIFDQHVCLSSLEDDLWGVMISGQAVSASIKVLYEVAWCASRPLFA